MHNIDKKLEAEIENLKKKLIEKQNLLKAKKEKEEQKVLNQIKHEFFRLKMVLNESEPEEIEPFKKFLIEHKFVNIIKNLFHDFHD